MILQVTSDNKRKKNASSHMIIIPNLKLKISLLASVKVTTSIPERLNKVFPSYSSRKYKRRQNGGREREKRRKEKEREETATSRTRYFCVLSVQQSGRGNGRYIEIKKRK